MPARQTLMALWNDAGRLASTSSSMCAVLAGAHNPSSDLSGACSAPSASATRQRHCSLCKDSCTVCRHEGDHRRLDAEHCVPLVRPGLCRAVSVQAAREQSGLWRYFEHDRLARQPRELWRESDARLRLQLQIEMLSACAGAPRRAAGLRATTHRLQRVSRAPPRRRLIAGRRTRRR